MVTEKQIVRTFSADTLREALAMVRAELGVDALILGQEQNGRRVTVRACLEMPESSTGDQSSDHSSNEPNSAESARDMAAMVSDVSIDVSVDRQAAAPLEKALASAANAFDRASEATAYTAYDAEVMSQLPQCSSLSELRRAVVTRLNYARCPIAHLHGVYRFIGNSGVGKTTSLIKVLVEWVMHNGPRDVAVLSTDNQRLAGTEALQLVCQMLNVTVEEVNPPQLKDALSRFAKKTLVLIDTPALSRGHGANPVDGVQDLWVCSALHGVQTLQAQYRAVVQSHPVGVVVTQVDQCEAGDDIANLLYQWRLPLYWLGTGSDLPDSIEIAENESLYRGLFPIQDVTARLDVAV